MHKSSLLDSLKAQPKEKCDYPCEFVECPPTLLQCVYSIYLQILCQPHLISFCDHNFCKVCIDQDMVKLRPCPLYCSSIRKLGCVFGAIATSSTWLRILSQNSNCLDVRRLRWSISTVVVGEWGVCDVIAELENKQSPQCPFCCAYCRKYNSIHANVVYRHRF